MRIKIKIIIIFLNLILYLSYNVKAENNISNNMELSYSPIGDNTNTEIYSFIQEALITSYNGNKQDIQKLRENEIANINNSDFKSHIANMYEGEIASLLRILCKAQPNCYEITIYQKNGVGIATSGLKEEIKFKEQRNIDFTIGILRDTLKNIPSSYIYHSNQDVKYFERLQAIYMNKKYSYSYLSARKKHPKDLLIGYVSYISQSR